MTVSCVPSASDAWLKLYLLLLLLPAYGGPGEWQVTSSANCCLQFGRGSREGTSYPQPVGSLNMALSTCDTNQLAASATSAFEVFAQHF